METGDYKLSQAAKSDLREIYRYGFFEHNEKQADKYYTGLFECFNQITEQPYLYPAVDHINEGYRRGMYGVHSIYYRVTNDTIEIILILRRQDPAKAFHSQI